ncbi:hypothetical protein F4808DRAFT_453982 [Astrocystis sublimbata]|nr:hypothetical protein F4808DRAFT_453982 [Astrocystis sublimbata]
MADDAPNTLFQSIAEAATATWYAHRAATPGSRPSPSVGHGGSQVHGQSMTPITPMPPILGMASATAVASVTSPSASTSPSGPQVSELHVPDGAGIRSDITAWHSSLQILPPDFANSELPLHPLPQALSTQPTLRPVEWNMFRQQGGFVPRTPHDFSSLMIYISGQVNPNPCRNCILKNGPFARCIVSPPAVLAISNLRHACANCTYQNQYRKCTNEPITEQENIRNEIQRFNRFARPRPQVPRKPKNNAKSKKRNAPGPEPTQAQQDQPSPKLTFKQPPTLTKPSGLGLIRSKDFASFDEKLRHIRASSPRSRRQLTAETLQWQAAIATVEAADLPAAPVPSMQTPINTATANGHLPASHYHNNHTPSQQVVTSNSHIPAPLNSHTYTNYALSQPIATTAYTFARHSPVRDHYTGAPAINYVMGDTAEPMDEDEDEDEDEDGDEDGDMSETDSDCDDIDEAPQSVGPTHTGPLIKTEE